MTASGNIYNFTLRMGEGQGYRIEGIVTLAGQITILKKEASFNTCPICLAKGTLIDTPAGSVPVEQLRKGMAVWTVNNSGKRIAVPVIETVVTPVPPFFQVLNVTLNDGRTVTASPGHPTAEGWALKDYKVGDTLDGASIIALEYLVWNGGATCDLLPSGVTGLYWANGILLRSSLVQTQ